MKIALIIVHFFSLTNLFGQSVHKRNNFPCESKRYLPCNTNNFEGTIDSISADDFKNILQTIYSKVKKKSKLTMDEEVKLVMLLNTLDWSGFDKQNISKFPLLDKIEIYFIQAYKKSMGCKYSVCLGKGGGLYYKELNIQYFGNPFACSRYFIIQ